MFSISLVAARRASFHTARLQASTHSAPFTNGVTLGKCPVRMFQGTRNSFAPVTMAFEKSTVADDIHVLQIGRPQSPAVIVVQEWWGLTEEVKRQASHIASVGGYRCIIPDLYKGKIGLDAEEASHLMSNLDFKGATDELVQIARWAKDSSPSAAVCGFCMGGALSLCAAQHSRDICAAVSFYGIPDRAVCKPDAIQVPVQLHFGELDNMKGFSDPESARSLAQTLSDGGVEYELFMYTGVGHAFMNSAADRPEITPGKHVSTGFPPSDSDQRELAWSRVFRFLQLAFADAPAAGRSSQPSS